MAIVAAAFFLAASLSSQDSAEGLAAHYGGTLDHEDGVGAVNWTAELDDVWELTSFAFEMKGKFELAGGPATLVLGKNESDETGRSAVWAAVFPDEPYEITTSESGQGDHATAFFMRFHPSRVGELFPADTVEAQGNGLALVHAKRQYGHKINACWQWDNMPMVPWPKSVTFDMDTREGKRRMYMLDTEENSVRYIDAFAERPLQRVEVDEIDKEEALGAFRKVWSAFDEGYPMFGLRPDVDWGALKDTYEPLIERATSQTEVAGVVGLLVSHLEDLHVWVKHGQSWVPTYSRFRVTNANWSAVKNSVKGLREEQGLAYGRIEDDGAGEIGYVMIWNLGTDGLSETFDRALEELGDTTGLIVDLRFNGGGDETLGRRIAARFLDKEAVYSKNQYRDGKKRDDLGEVLERSFEPRGPWRYVAPVVVLQGQKTMSSAESLALMFAQCPRVTTMGDRTAGSSGNPKRISVAGGITVNMPRWLDMDPDGKPIDGVGVAPDVQCEETRPGDFKSSDPVFEAAIAHLGKVEGRTPGKAGQ